MGKQLPTQPCLYSQQAYISVSSFFHVVFSIWKEFHDFYLINTDSHPSRYFRHHLLNEALLKLHSLLREYASPCSTLVKFLSPWVINFFFGNKYFENLLMSSPQNLLKGRMSFSSHLYSWQGAECLAQIFGEYKNE